MMLEKFDIVKGDVVSIVGSGGKTTLMMVLARQAKSYGRVLVTTSTKVGFPGDLYEDEVFYKDLSDYENDYNCGNLVIMGSGTQGHKIQSIDDAFLNKVIKDFDYIFIEADGSKRLPFKAWRSFEPVVLKATTKTIGVFPLKYLNKEIPKDLIFNYEKFEKDFDFQGKLDYDLIVNIIKHQEGILKNSYKNKYIYFSQIEDRQAAQMLISSLSGEFEDIKFTGDL